MSPAFIGALAALGGAFTLIVGILFGILVCRLTLMFEKTRPAVDPEYDYSDIDDWTPEGDQLNPVRDVNASSHK